MAILLTGGAGFVAATLIGRLLSSDETVISVDNLSRGSLDSVKTWLDHPSFAFIRADLSDLAEYCSAIRAAAERDPITEVWHLAANSDIPAGIRDPDVDLRDTFMTTFNTLKIMDEFGIRRIFFASSSAIYGDLQDTLLTESTGPLFPISNYGAMKLASEAAITAAAEKFLDRALIFRFPNVVGVPATHGVLLDFMHRLKQAPGDLQVLGDGTQRKPYLHVTDLVDGMMFLRQHSGAKVEAFNIGPDDDGITVGRIAEEVVACVAPCAKVHFQSGSKGWVGDVPRFRYSTEKLQRLGWTPKLDSLGAIRRAITEIADQVFTPATGF
ncbi:MAG TPA: NAD-dependent epimerase/dehydratase family protein [Bryobacteraceae bacterium]|nr:NAD-dependent epimerase/dehydratase family protein [Bryobacteraceae bacterium]